MNRWRAFAFALALVVASSCCAGELKITLIGNEAFHITDGKTTLLSDFPYKSGSFGYHTYSAANVPPIKNGLSLITHAHADHWSKPDFETMKLSVIGPPALTERVDQKRVIPLTLDRPMLFGDIQIEAIKTPHKLAAEHFSYRVTWHGLRLYFPGDTESPADVLAQKDIDVMFITPWLLESIQQSGNHIDAKTLIAYHLKPDETALPLQDCKTMKQGESITVAYTKE